MHFVQSYYFMDTDKPNPQQWVCLCLCLLPLHLKTNRCDRKVIDMTLLLYIGGRKNKGCNNLGFWQKDSREDSMKWSVVYFLFFSDWRFHTIKHIVQYYMNVHSNYRKPALWNDNDEAKTARYWLELTVSCNMYTMHILIYPSFFRERRNLFGSRYL